MIVCITSSGPDLESQADPRFGRCAYFIFFDTDSQEHTAVANPQQDAAGGAGVQSGQLVVERKAGVVLTGNVGPNAFQVLNAAGIPMVTGVSGTVGEVIKKYQQGVYSQTQTATVAPKHGQPGFGKMGRQL